MESLNVLLNAGDFGKFFDESADKIFLVREIFRCGDKDNHKFAIATDAPHYMTQKTFVSVLVVGLQVEFRSDFADGGENFIVLSVLNHARSGIDNFVTAASVATDLKITSP